MNHLSAIPRSQHRGSQPPLSLLEQELASLLAEILVADYRAARLEREREATVNHGRP